MESRTIGGRAYGRLDRQLARSRGSLVCGAAIAHSPPRFGVHEGRNMPDVYQQYDCFSISRASNPPVFR